MTRKYNSQKTKCEKKYNMELKSILSQMISNGMSCEQIAFKLEYETKTIKSYLSKYKINYHGNIDYHNAYNCDQLFDILRSNDLNVIKIISMKWV